MKELETIKLLISTQRKYIELLEEELSRAYPIAYNHHYRPDDREMKLGERLRKEISNLEK